ncbi:MAG: site-specific integrase [Xenococcaceae cyanobacterium]
MQSSQNTPTSKKPRKKGNVGLYSQHGRLYIALPRALNGGQQFKKALGLPDDSNGWAQAEKIAKQIESDLERGDFDLSLDRYFKKQEQKIVLIKPYADLSELWEKYIDYKRKTGWSESTYSNTGIVYLKRFSKLKTQDINKPGDIRRELIESLSLDGVKRSLTQIHACVTWAAKSNYIPESLKNKFEGFAQDIKTPKQEDEDLDIDPFTAAERDAIIKAFETNQFAQRNKEWSHSQYASLVKAWFFTGCRTGEILGLRWENVDSHKLTLKEGRVMTNNGQIKRSRLKTQAKRTFPVNKQLRAIFESMEGERFGYVFLNHEGNPIHPKSFTDCWGRVLKALGIKYRRPYQCRHTFITLSLATEMKVHDVARICGTSPEMIYKHYLGIDPDRIVVPDL